MQRALAESETKGGKPPDKNAPPVPKPLPPAKEIITAEFMAREDFSNESFERLAKIILKNLEDGDNQKGNMEVIKDVINKNCLWSNQASQVLSSFTDQNLFMDTMQLLMYKLKDRHSRFVLTSQFP